jgi:hypothetical protein
MAVPLKIVLSMRYARMDIYDMQQQRNCVKRCSLWVHGEAVSGESRHKPVNLQSLEPAVTTQLGGRPVGGHHSQSPLQETWDAKESSSL